MLISHQKRKHLSLTRKGRENNRPRANAKDGTMLTLQTANPVEKVDQFYVKQLKDQGWTTESTVKFPQGTNYGNKKETRTLNVSINGGDQTMIMLMVGEEK
jgi:hypothetical protein